MYKEPQRNPLWLYTTPKSIAGKPCQCAWEVPSSFVLIRVVELCKNTSLWLHVTNQWFFFRQIVAIFVLFVEKKLGKKYVFSMLNVYSQQKFA
jgi:hypothetical protein